MDEQGRPVLGDIERANLLASTYQKIFTDAVPSQSDSTEERRKAMLMEVLPRCTEGEAFKLLNSLNIKKAPGPDGIHPLVLQRLAPVLAVPIAELINKSLQSGIIPVAWKEATVKPFYKGGDKQQPINYRPVSLTSVVCKLMERWVKELFCKQLDNLGIMAVQQHGFTKKKSCVTNLMQAHESWVKNMDARVLTDVIYFDFSKAFDRVDHTTLVNLLAGYGLPQYLINWTEDFLRGRTFQVRVNGTLSERLVAQSGVPQGSVLGPLLFNLYINKIPERISSDCLFFADDLKIWRAIHDEADVLALQHDVDSLLEVAAELKLPVNVAKCQHLPVGGEAVANYHLGDETIKTESVVRDLGLLNRSDMKTKSHTTHIVKKGFRFLWALRRSFKYWNAEAVPRLVNTFIRPLMEYGAPAYFPITKGECGQLERIQRTATRLIPALRSYSYLERCVRLDMFTLEYRRTRMDLIFTYKVLCLKVVPMLEQFFNPSRETRTRGHIFKLDKSRMKRLQMVYSLPARIVNLWNQLPPEIVKATTVEKFKKLIDKHLWYDSSTWRREPLPGEAYPRMPTPPHIS
jgi:hypothetical protein